MGQLSALDFIVVTLRGKIPGVEPKILQPETNVIKIIPKTLEI